MFKHLDDPAPLAPTTRTLRAVLSRAARMRRQRVASGFAALGVLILVVGLVIGLAVPRSLSDDPGLRRLRRTRGSAGRGNAGSPGQPGRCRLHQRFRRFRCRLPRGVLRAGDDPRRRCDMARGGRPPPDGPACPAGVRRHHPWLPVGGTPSPLGTVPLWVTSDGGRTWTQAPVGPVVSDVSAIGANVWAVVGTCALSSLSTAPACPATVDVSLNDGATWTPTTNAPPVDEEPGLSVADQDLELARITRSRAYVLMFAPARAEGEAALGRIAYTFDGGRTWSTRPDPCPTFFDVGQEIAASGTDDLWMVCASQPSGGSQAKALYRSRDGGRHWTLTAAANAPVLSGNVSLPSGGGLPVGGYVSPYSLGHQNLAVLTPDAAWFFPDRSGVFETTDGGHTWSTVSGLARAGLVAGGSGNIVFVDADHGWVCEVGAGLWRTTDGVHWKHLGS